MPHLVADEDAAPFNARARGSACAWLLFRVRDEDARDVRDDDADNIGDDYPVKSLSIVCTGRWCRAFAHVSYNYSRVCESRSEC